MKNTFGKNHEIAMKKFLKNLSFGIVVKKCTHTQHKWCKKLDRRPVKDYNNLLCTHCAVGMLWMFPDKLLIFL